MSTQRNPSALLVSADQGTSVLKYISKHFLSCQAL